VNPGEKVSYTIHHKGGYVFDHPVPGIVIRQTTKRVRIAIWSEQHHEIEEKSVHPAYISPRTTPASIDAAMEEARRFAAPYLEAMEKAFRVFTP